MPDDVMPAPEVGSTEPDAGADPRPGPLVTRAATRRQPTGPWRGHGPRPWGPLSPTS